jgi:hypothetical protein
VAEFLEMAALITFVVAVTGLLLAFVIRYVAITTPPTSAGSDDRDGTRGAVDHRVADRPEEHPLEGTAAAGSEHH